MQKKRFALLFIILTLILTNAFSQGMGAIFDEQYDSLPRRAELSASSYEGLPSSYSLKQYAPLPGDQTDYGTCVAWAASYAARTISESIALNRLNQTETTQNAFSVVYVYRNIRPDDPYGYYGAHIYSALDYMAETGTVKMLDVERTTSFPLVDLAYYRTARNYPIAGYVTLFSYSDRQKPALVTRVVKKSLSEGKPVIIGMNTPDSFIDAKDVWRPVEDPRYFYGGHAMCVVGYDDDRYGGAFEVLNSWGRKWGNGGYIWIPYDVFVAFVTEAYEIIENIANYSDTLRFEGSIQVNIFNPDTAETTTAGVTLNQVGYYTTEEEITEGTEISFSVGAGESAYVYCFTVLEVSGENNFYSPVLLFPQTGVSPLLNYTDAVIELPGEGRTIDFDSSGTSYIITLYSKYALDINNIIRVFSSTQGSINKRMVAALGDFYTTELEYSETEAAFTVTPEDRRAITALIVAIGEDND